MASRALLKIKINQNLPFRFLSKTNSILTRSVVPLAQPEASKLSLNNNFSLLGGVTYSLFARQMGTSKSPSTSRGRHPLSDEDDEDFDGKSDDESEFDDEFNDGEDEEEEEEAPKKKFSSRK
ncbi:hypothetical protein MtrunA17_Chr8g0360051 [Medicago truncatula]|uniref:Uncharacterized protein n=1 Tax=Medicago truncatula TaxID=3880 RepID=A0A072TRH5_MEDTR|nr:uncharacterized protein LOC120577328 [Medicago truncatula]KEH19423.1 hypothetical protein MTR_8g058985 [Medicago truncatula]RHN40897.1 hypothetical protein MtrunA17_Chr8g0360051 [Medicago truncatula]